VVALLVAILATIAVPSFNRQMQDMRRVVAIAQLASLKARQEQYFVDHKRYASSFSALGFSSATMHIDREGEEVDSDSLERIYRIEMLSRSNGYTLIARPQLEQSKDEICASIKLTSTGVKSVTGTGRVEACR